VRRRLFNFAASVSLVLCVGTMGLWAASARNGKKIHWARRDGRYVLIGCIQNHACISITKPWPCNERLAFDDSEPFAMVTALPKWQHLYMNGYSGSGFVVVGVDGKVPDLPQGGRASFSWAFGPKMPPGSSFTRPITGWLALIPIWMLVGLSSLLPVAWFSDSALATYRRRQRTRRGLCPSCGYDLTGNTSGVCPECGTAIPKAPAEKSPRLA
jgi:hypothetical protein